MTARARNVRVASAFLVVSLLGATALRGPDHRTTFHRLVNARGMPLRIVVFTPTAPPDAEMPAVVLAEPVNTPTEYGRALTLELVTEGYRVLTFDWRGWEPNENSQFARIGTPEILLLDMTAAVAYLRSLPDVDGERIAVTGARPEACWRFRLAHWTLEPSPWRRSVWRPT